MAYNRMLVMRSFRSCVTVSREKVGIYGIATLALITLFLLRVSIWQGQFLDLSLIRSGSEEVKIVCMCVTRLWDVSRSDLVEGKERAWKRRTRIWQGKAVVPQRRQSARSHVYGPIVAPVVPRSR
jgi:hypothetical protein